MRKLSIFLFTILIFVACKTESTTDVADTQQEEKTPMQENLAKYTDFTLSADLSTLSDNQKEIVKQQLCLRFPIVVVVFCFDGPLHSS